MKGFPAVLPRAHYPQRFCTDRVLGTAVAANADVIVTGDKGLLRLHPFRGIHIVTAREFLDLVGP